MRVKWEAAVVGSTSATPTVHNGFVYVPDWEGWMYCLDAESGGVVWQRQIKDYLAALGVALPGNLGPLPILSRTSPVVFGDLVVIGTMQVWWRGGWFVAAAGEGRGDRGG